jgi:FtsX-like permease family
MHYLESCLEAFPETCKKKYGVAFDLASIERKVAHLRRHSPLTYKDLKFFESPEHWWFKRFWVFPPEEHLGPALKGVTFDFWNLPGKKEENLIGKLLHAFKAIELVSIILRFIRPEKYAIFSSPTEMLLEIRRGRSPIETYVNYLTDLRLIQRQYRFGRVADVDMALWVLHEKCYGTHKDPKIERAFSGDTFLIRLIAKNLSSRLNDRSDAQLANALREAKPDLAALIACYAEAAASHWQVQAVRNASSLASILGLLALLLASIGIYGVMAYSVNHRTREIGIRMALGASYRDVLRLIVGQGLRLVAIGVALGLAGGAALSRLLSSMLFGLSPFDPVAYVGVSLFLVTVALAATYLPAWRASKVDPMVALRHD